MTIQDVQQVVQNAYNVELLGIGPQLWVGEEPESFVVFWRAKEKQPGGQYTLCTVKKDEKIEHKGNFEEHSDAQEAFCRLVFPYQR